MPYINSVKIFVDLIKSTDLPLDVRVHVELLSRALDELDELQDNLELVPTTQSVPEVMRRFARVGSTIAQSAGTIAREVDA